MTDDFKKVSLTVSIHSGNFSILPSRADTILMNVNLRKQKVISPTNHIIYVIDVSSNMSSEYLDCIRRAIRGPHTNYASVNVITFADTAQILPLERLNELKAGEYGANLEIALRTAFDLAETLDTGLCGIVVFSASDLTSGYLQAGEFSDFVNEFRPARCFIETVGIGMAYEVDILEAVGRYRFASNCEVLTSHIHIIKNIVASAVAVNCRITLFMPPDLTDLPEGLIPATLPDPCLVVARKSVRDTFDRNIIVLGTLCHGENYASIIFPFGYTSQKELLRRINNRDIELNYTNTEGEATSLVAKLKLPSKITSLPLVNYADYYIWDAKRRLRTALLNDRNAGTLEDKLLSIHRCFFLPDMYPTSIEEFGIPNLDKYATEEKALLEICLRRINSFLPITQRYLELLSEQMSTTGTFERITVLEIRELLNL